MTRRELSLRIKELALAEGFHSCGIAQAGPIGRKDCFQSWLESGRAGSMEYMKRYLDQRMDPRQLLEGCSSVVVVALSYHQPRPPRPDADCGKVAMYAWGDDYHEIVKVKLKALLEQMQTAISTPFTSRVCVDTAPVLEREWAAAAGVGWIGKNTLVLDQRLGSYYFLGEILTTLELEPDEPVPDHCGTCTACLDACPTSAFPAPYEMDASRCISYLTIEHRGEIAKEFHEPMGRWVFGCDVCQEVCPHNHRAPLTTEPRLAVRPPAPEPVLHDLLTWTPDDYRASLKGSAMKRAKLDMLQRNARIAAGNVRAVNH